MRAHIKRVNHAGFPEAVQAAGHDIIHHIIFIGNRIKYAAHKPLLVIARHVAKTKINGFSVLLGLVFGFVCRAHNMLPDSCCLI